MGRTKMLLRSKNCTAAAMSASSASVADRDSLPPSTLMTGRSPREGGEAVAATLFLVVVGGVDGCGAAVLDVGIVAHAGNPLNRDDEMRNYIRIPPAPRQEAADAHASVVAVVLGPVASEHRTYGYLDYGNLELGVIGPPRRAVFIPIVQLARRVARARHHRLRALAAAAEAKLHDGSSIVVHQLDVRLLGGVVSAYVQAVRFPLAGAAVDGARRGEEVRRELDGLNAVEVYVAVSVGLRPPYCADVERGTVEVFRGIVSGDGEVLPSVDDGILLFGRYRHRHHPASNDVEGRGERVVCAAAPPERAGVFLA